MLKNAKNNKKCYKKATNAKNANVHVVLRTAVANADTNADDAHANVAADVKFSQSQCACAKVLSVSVLM